MNNTKLEHLNNLLDFAMKIPTAFDIKEIIRMINEEKNKMNVIHSVTISLNTIDF